MKSDSAHSLQDLRERSPLLKPLNDQQLSAVLQGDGPAMVLAGAGSGKTRVLTTRVAYLMTEKNVSPNSILLVTFTNKAAAEMTNRVQQMTGKRPQFSGTFHRLCARILRQDGILIGIPPTFSIYDDDDQLDLVKSILKKLNLSVKEFNPRLMLSMISNAKNELLSPKDYQIFAKGKIQEAASRVYQLYEKELDKNGAVDFDNLLNKTVELFRKHPNILQKYQHMFEYVLVDEYQDVNKAQYLLTKMLASPQNNLFAVGDFSQSIYAWRGADYRNMLALKTDFPGIQEYRLEQNYRSTQTILDAASAVISHNTSHPILELWTEKTDKRRITLYEAETERDEAEFVTHHIQQFKKILPFSEMVVLYRTNAQSRVFEELFLKYGVPYKLVGGVRFYARKEVKDVLSLLLLFVNEHDSVALSRIEKLGKKRLQVYLSWLASTKKFPEKTLDILDAVLEASQYLTLYDERLEEDVERLENIQELRSVASEFPDVPSVLENVALVENDTLPDSSSSNQQQDVVSLMSIHAAKGLEFGAVFLVGMEEGLFPHSRSLMDKHQLEEERRLCYVAITRAKEHLYISYTRRRLLYGAITGSIVSRFIAEIPDHTLERKGGNHSMESLPGLQRSATPQHISRRFSQLSDETLERVLKGEIDVESFLDM